MTPQVSAGNTALGVLIAGGVLVRRLFDSDGSLRRFQADTVGPCDFISASTPFDRLSLHDRATSDARFVPDFLVPPLTIEAMNPFLHPNYDIVGTHFTAGARVRF